MVPPNLDEDVGWTYDEVDNPRVWMCCLVATQFRRARNGRTSDIPDKPDRPEKLEASG